VKVSVSELPPRQVSLAIEVEQERVDRAVDESFRRLANQVDVPGFRRGKAPRPMIERMLGHNRIVEDAIERLVPDVVAEAIVQERVEPFTRPRVESIEFDPLRVKAVVGLAPKVELGNYQGDLKILSEEAKVDAEQIDAVINRLRESYAQWAPVDRAVQQGDRVGLDLHGTVEGRDKPLMDAKEAEYIVDPDGAQPAPGFAEQLVGLEASATKSFTLKLPEDHRDEDVRGQDAEFSVTVHWVKERQLPELDDEFAQQVGEYTDVAGLRTAVEAQLQQREEERVREQLETAALDKLVELASIEYPPQLVDHQAQHMLDTLTRNVEQQGLQLQQYLRLVGKEQVEFQSDIRSEAELRVRRSLALDAFADAEKIEAGAQAEDAESESSRERKALARLIELATGNGRAGTRAEKTAARAKTSDTEKTVEEE
jgi:trigger factor